jgi:hypothetical protein
MEKVATVHQPLKIRETNVQIDRSDLEIHVHMGTGQLLHWSSCDGNFFLWGMRIFSGSKRVCRCFGIPDWAVIRGLAGP